MNPDTNDDISEHISTAIESGKSVLTLEESRKIMELSGIPFNRSGLATSEEEAVKLANEIGYPVVLKVVSPQVIHKTEAGGVKMGIDSDEEIRKAYNDIISSIKEKVPDAEIDGISVDEMVCGTELIIGTSVDPQFGHMIMFGIGGIFVEIYKDVSFRLVPITPGDARDMLKEIKGKPLLEGARGRPKVDEKQLVDVLVKVSDLVSTFPKIREMDINPLIITEDGLVAVDARIVLDTLMKEEKFKEIVKDIEKMG